MQGKANISLFASPAILFWPGTAKEAGGSFTPALNEVFLEGTVGQQTTSCCLVTQHASQLVTLIQFTLASTGER